MNKKRNNPGVALLLTLVLGLLLLAGCSSKSEKTGSGNKDKGDNTGQEANSDTEFDPDEEITLKFMAPWSDQQVASRFKDEFEKEYPNITIEPIVEWTDKAALEDLFAKKIFPDVLLVLGDYQELNGLEMLTPLDEMVEKHQLDLSKYREGAIEAIRSRDPEGEERLLGLPIEDVMFAMFYNKDVFDTFGVKYPHDGMTWEEVIDLVPKVTGERNGVNYVGLPTNSWSQAFQQLSVTGTDPETGEVLFVDQPEFAKYFNLIEQLGSIPGNKVEDPEETHFKAGNVAMNLLTVSNIPNMGGEDGVNFDIVRFPTWKDLPDIVPNNLPLTLAISPQSKHKEAAFKLLEFVSTKEQQINMAKAGVAPVLNDPEIASYLAGEDSDLNIKGVYSGTPAKPATYSPYGPDMIYYSTNFLGTKTTEFLEQQVDVNTFIRTIEEEYETIVKEKKAQE
ncbi:ABC transporter substrate-binding protein [Bacillus sp. FSL K6-3431]|uniref:ABC transporter substrate-binding protein n=1 Tax=Bacillus sp. FSL K6-3431 TaxID=2921500 RepID=UPI0030F7889F